MVRPYHEDRIPTVYSREELPVRERRPGVTQSYFRGLDVLVGFTTLQPGAPGDFHAHPWEQVTMVIDGSLTFHVGDDERSVSAGDIFVIPPDVPHYAEPGESASTICFISPLREDLLPFLEYQEEFHHLDGS